MDFAPQASTAVTYNDVGQFATRNEPPQGSLAAVHAPGRFGKLQ